MLWPVQVEQHYAKAWPIEPIVCAFADGPIHELPADFHILRFPPHGTRVLWTYATCGMSQPDDAEPIELHVFAPRESEEVVELLYAIAHFHRTGAPLALGHTVRFGKPWIGGSVCDHGLVSLPYLDGPGLEKFDTGSKVARFYWLIPITAAEVAFKKEHGLEALEQKLEDEGFDYADPSRTSVV